MFTSLLEKSAIIKRKTIVQLNTGETIDSWVDVGTYQTRYAKNSGAGITDGVYKKTSEDYLFFFEVEADIILADEIFVDNLLFKVKSVDTFDNDTMPHHIEVTAEKIINS